MRTVYTTIIWAVLHIFMLPASAFAQSESTDIQVLMLDVCTYDPYYTEQISQTVALLGDDVEVLYYSAEAPRSLESVLENIDLVIVPYPHKGMPKQLKAFGADLSAFAQRGGMVAFTGTHDMTKLNMFNILHCERGAYNPLPQVQRLAQVLFTRQIPAEFTSSNYTYPVTITNRNYVSLATDDGGSVYGYMKQGAGLIFYVGMEFYTIEAVNKAILNNLVSFARQQKQEKAAASSTTTNGSVQGEACGGAFDIRNVSSRPNIAVDWKVYPNPYITRTQVDFVVERPSRVEVSIFNELGQLISRPVTDNTYESGRFSLEINELPYGTFYIQMRIGEQTSVKKMVRVQAP